MNTLLKCFVMALTMLTCAPAGLAQSIEYGRRTKVLPYGFTLLHGNNWTRPLFGVKEYTRYIDYVVSELYTWPLGKAVPWPSGVMADYRPFSSSTPFPFHTEGVDAIDLERGYSYVQIRKPNLPLMQPIDYVRVTFADPGRFGPIILPELGGNPLVARTKLTRSAAWFAANPWVGNLLSDPKPFITGARSLDVPREQVAVVAGSWDKISAIMTTEPLIERLFSVDFDAAPAEQTLLTAQVIMLSSAQAAVANAYAYFSFPFILARRTSSGAEGTEVVVYAGPDPDPAKGGEEVVYNFYVAGNDPAKSVQVYGHWSDGGVDMITPVTKISICEYARVPLKKILGEWYVTGECTITKGKIKDAHLRLKELIRMAHKDACIAQLNSVGGILPSDIVCGKSGDFSVDCEVINNDP